MNKQKLMPMYNKLSTLFFPRYEMAVTLYVLFTTC